MGEQAKKANEKVTYLADDLGSIMTLKDLIDDIRNDRLKNFILIAQARSHEGTELTRGIELNSPNSSGKVLKYYFYGDDSSTHHLGLCNRLAYLINQYMDGVDIFGDEGDYDG